MSDQDIDVFAGVTSPEPVVAKYEDLVGEGKKYKTQDDAATALMEKDRYIKQLERENAEAREAALKRINEEEFLAKLEAIARPQSPNEQDNPVERRDEPDKSAITPETVERILEERDAKKLREANINAVTAKLQDVYGDDYRSRVQSQAKALGVGTDFLTDVATKNPQAFYKLMGMDQAKREDPFSPPPRTSVIASTAPQTGKKDYNYFRKLRAEKGDGWYFSLPVQQEIWRAAKEAESRGESFLPDN